MGGAGVLEIGLVCVEMFSLGGKAANPASLGSLAQTTDTG
tara:strand:- start:330910 stop:331029 length:120 start_codon:yes stop_codon:yes gene_type:complete